MRRPRCTLLWVRTRRRACCNLRSAACTSQHPAEKEAPLNRSQQNAQQVDKENAMREQQIVNTRVLGLRHAQKIASLRAGVPGQPVTTSDQLIKDAKAIADFLIGDL